MPDMTLAHLLGNMSKYIKNYEFIGTGMSIYFTTEQGYVLELWLNSVGMRTDVLTNTDIIINTLTDLCPTETGMSMWEVRDLNGVLGGKRNSVIGQRFFPFGDAQAKMNNIRKVMLDYIQDAFNARKLYI